MPDVTGLFDSFLEAAVSLAVLFVIIAWVSSKIVELGQLTFNVHGKMLRDELERCFGEDRRNDPNKGRFTRYFYWHPMIVPLTQPSGLVSFWRRISGGLERLGWLKSGDPESRFPPGRLPGHIAPESFAAVVMNPFPWPTTEEALRRLLIANPDPDIAERPEISDGDIRKMIRAGQTSTAGETWGELIARAKPASAPSLNPDFLASRVDIHGGPVRGHPAERYVEMCRANELVPHPLETRIITLLRDADNDLDDFRSGLRRWYAEAMARVTGRFKRTALIWVFFVALIVCTLFNLNAINLFSALMASPELRAAGVAASQAVGTRPGGIEALGQKAAYSSAYACVDPRETPQRPVPNNVLKNPVCKARLLGALWRDSRKANAVDALFSNDGAIIPRLATDGPGGAPRSRQVETVHRLCGEQPGLCGTGFKAKLDDCVEAGGGRPARQCDDAWAAIWSSSGFFWHPEAAHKLALSLTPAPEAGENTELPDLLYNVKRQADAETQAVTKFLGDLPDVGPVWKDKKLWKDKENGSGKEFVLGALLWSLLGILLSAALAALGAPFWYDVLGKLSRRNTSGARGEKT
jgi:hypothetical protein